MVSRFGNKGAATAAQGKQAAAGPRKSKYEGVLAAADGPPQPWPGAYLVEIVECTDDNGQGSNDTSMKAHVKIHEIDADSTEAQAKHNPGDTCFVIVGMTSGNGMRPGLQRCKRFVMACAGYEEEGDYTEFDPRNVFLDLVSGVKGPGSEKYPEGVIGRLAVMIVNKGPDKSDGSGDFYRNYQWLPGHVWTEGAPEDKLVRHG